MSKREQEAKYFTPEVPKVEGLALKPSETELADELKELVDSNGLIKTEMETDVVLGRIAKDIYKNELAGYRETYANALTACQRAVQLFKASPSIEITFDMDNRMLEIKEIDSTGITPAEFRDIYRVVGRTGNADGTMLGQFGFGRLAWVQLSDRMILETKYRSTDGKTGAYAFENKEGRAFAPIPAAGRDSFGTTHKLFLYDTVDLEKLLAYIKAAGEMAPIKTTLRLIRQFKESTSTLNKTPAELFKEQANTNDSRAVLTTEILSYKDEDIELYGAFEVRSWRWDSRNNDDISFGDGYSVTNYYPQVYLLGIPIETDYSAPKFFSRCIINILNERKYVPTADRDRLREDSNNALAEKIRQVSTAILEKRLNIKSIADYMALPKVWKLVVGERQMGVDLGPVVELVSSHVSLRGSNARWKTSVGKILNTTDKARLFYQLNSSSSHYFDKARSIVPGAMAMIIHSEAHAKLLDDYGIKNLSIFKGTKSGPNVPTDVVVYTYTSNGIRVELSKLTSMTIKIPEGKLLKPYISLISHVRTDYVITRDSKILNGVGILLDDLLKNVGNKKITTSAGEMKVKDVPKDAVPLLGVYDIPSAAKLLFGKLTARDVVDNPEIDGLGPEHLEKPLLGILADANTIFELVLYFTEKKQKFIEDFNGRLTACALLRIAHQYDNQHSYYYHQLWARMHIHALCSDPELDVLMQVVIDHTSSNDLLARRKKIFETLDRLQKPGGRPQRSA
jgi:hypothetical protein